MRQDTGTGTDQAINRIPSEVREYLEDLSPGLETVRVIKDKYPRLVILLKLAGRDCLLKTVRAGIPWQRPGRYFRLQKECFIYSRLQHIYFDNFLHPALLHTNNKNFILIQYIRDDPSLPRGRAFYARAIKAVAELNGCDFPFSDRGGPGWFREKANRWKHSRTTKTLRNLLEGYLVKKRIKSTTFAAAFSFWMRSIRKSAVLDKPLLVHRDIFKANILRPDRERLYFTDFEKTGLEKRWVFSDALKIAQAEPMFFSDKDGEFAGFPRFYTGLLNDFWQDIAARRPGIRNNSQEFRLQLKFCLLGWTLKKLVKEKPSLSAQKNLVDFLDTVILGTGHHFEAWLDKCPEQAEEQAENRPGLNASRITS